MVKTMNFGNVMVLAMTLAAVTMMLHTTEAAEYVVGDDLGWTVPPGGAASYASWAAKYSFVVDDILYFNFTEGEHTVALVTKENYEICNTTDPLFKLDGPSALQFLASDTFYFTCTFAGHCAGGQKVAVISLPLQTLQVQVQVLLLLLLLLLRPCPSHLCPKNLGSGKCNL
nr:mavicyanin-like [Malus domestica]